LLRRVELMAERSLEARDMAGGSRPLLFYWGLPIAAMVGAVALSRPATTIIWIAALLWMGAACLINARRCGRTHCRYTGPFFLFMIVPVSLHGFELLPLGGEGWVWLGIAIGIGNGMIWWVSEAVLGKYQV
jgi:hypothetical protein